MSAIRDSVGRGGVNTVHDVTTVQALLNRHLKPPATALKVDGACGPKTIAAIEDVQRRLVKMPVPDGRVDVGGRTLAALTGGATPPAPAGQPAKGLPSGGGRGSLTEADFARAAATLTCEVACVKAVTAVESGASGYFASGRPKILFEAHVFSKLTKHKYDASHPDISSPHWNRALYAGGEKEYGRLEKAMALDHDAALQSASWGRFQVMGFHYKICGYGTVDAFVQAMYRSEGEQLAVFVKFIQHQHLGEPLREKRWAAFARGYNGAGYATNHYDTKLAAAYAKFAAGK